MGDIKQSRSTKSVRLYGDDEDYAVDIVLKPDGSHRLLVDSETSISTDLQIIQEYDQNQTLDDTVYTDIYADTGIVTISGFSLEFDDKKPM